MFILVESLFVSIRALVILFIRGPYSTNESASFVASCAFLWLAASRQWRKNIPCVKRERKKVGNDANGIMAIKDEIACVDHAAQQANLPKTGGNYAFLRSF